MTNQSNQNTPKETTKKSIYDLKVQARLEAPFHYFAELEKITEAGRENARLFLSETIQINSFKKLKEQYPKITFLNFQLKAVLIFGSLNNLSSFTGCPIDEILYMGESLLFENKLGSTKNHFEQCLLIAERIETVTDGVITIKEIMSELLERWINVFNCLDQKNIIDAYETTKEERLNNIKTINKTINYYC